MWLYIFRAFCVARVRYTRPDDCAESEDAPRLMRLMLTAGKIHICRLWGGGRGGHVLTARRTTVDKVDPVALISESCVYFTEAQNKSNLTKMNLKGKYFFEIYEFRGIEVKMNGTGNIQKWQPPSVQFMRGLVSQGCEVRRFRNCMEIQMNGTRNEEVLKQRSNRTANHRVTSICDDLSCR